MRHRSDSLNLLRGTSAAANESSSIDEALAVALGEVCEFTGWPIGHAFLVGREDPSELVSTGIWRIPDEPGYAAFRAAIEGRRPSAGRGLADLALETRRPVQASAGNLRGRPAAGLAVPIMAGNHAVGVMEFFAEEPLPADAELLDLLLSVGTQLGRVVERQLSEEARLRALIDNMPAHVYLRDLAGRYILVNRQYEQFWDLRLDEIRGKTLTEAVALTDVELKPEVHEWIDREVVATGRPSRHEANVLRRGKEHVIADVRFPVLDGSDQIVAVAGIDIDITAQKRNEAELAELLRRVEMARDAATEAASAKSRFLANMSHELRTPLNAIIGFTRLVTRKADGLPPKQVDNLGKILTSAEHLLALIDDILDLSRAEAGKLSLDVAETDVAGVLREVADSLEPLVDRPRVRVTVDADPDLPRVATDRDKVKQILLNLLSNAIKYTDHGSIRMRADAVDGRLRIAVSDTGIGIPPNELGRVFLEFHRADSTATRARGGTGLGLSISQRLARALGGAITVDSRLGAGSTFTVDLPMRP